MSEVELTFDGINSILDNTHISERRTDEFYAVSQLLALGILSEDEQKSLGAKLVAMLERDHWWGSNGAFNDE